MIAAAGLGTIIDVAGGEVWEPARLEAEIARRVGQFRRLGLGPGQRAIIAHGGGPAFFADLLACWRLGACAACINPDSSRAELDNIAGAVTPALVLGPVDKTLDIPVVDTTAETGAAAEAGPPDSGANLDDPALILFTSGTTGAPKGVVHSFRALLARVALNRLHIGDGALARSLCVLPTHFGHGLIGNCLTPLLAGKTLLLAPGIDLAGAARLGPLVDDHAVTFLSSVPALWKLVLKLSKPPAGQSLAQVNVGSAPLSASHWRAIGDWTGTANVVNMYGITEAANWICGASARDHPPEDGLIGTMWGGSIAVRDEDGTIRTKGAGELIVQTPSLMQGYYQRPELTDAALVAGWLRTGDTGRIDECGVARLTGRIKHEINRAGIKIQPEDIDLLLERHPAVLEACAFGIPDPVSGEIVGVAVHCADGAGESAESLRRWCLERLRREAVPERWFLVAEIPKTDRGKINRQAVWAHCAGDRSAGSKA